MEIMQYVGMDVHKDQIEIAVFSKEGRTAELVTKIPNQESSLRKFFAKLQEKGEVIAGYEAGCLGFDSFRMLESIGVLCVVIAPSKIARKPGDKVKTDRKDAILLARGAFKIKHAAASSALQAPVTVRCRKLLP